MISLKILFLIFSVTLGEDYYTKCAVTFQYQEYCFRYHFSKSCVPWNVSTCKFFEIVPNEYLCPSLDCSVSLILFCMYPAVVAW